MTVAPMVDQDRQRQEQISAGWQTKEQATEKANVHGMSIGCAAEGGSFWGGRVGFYWVGMSMAPLLFLSSLGGGWAANQIFCSSMSFVASSRMSRMASRASLRETL